MKIVLRIGYIGTSFKGFQKQKETEETVEGYLERALFKVLQRDPKLKGASRTDSGVHALAQMVEFQGIEEIPTSKYVNILNGSLPETIRVYEALEVADDFHVRYSAQSKTYLYRIDCNEVPLLTFIPFASFCPYKLDLAKMERASLDLKGEHDFRSFAAAGHQVKDFSRNITAVTMIKQENNILEFRISGDGFLYKMVRTIVGTLIDIGRGQIEEDAFKKALLDLENGRQHLGKTAPGKGLILEDIKY